MKKRVPAFKSILTSLLVTISILPCFSQTDDTHQDEKGSENSVRFSLGADLVSRYIWRGKDYGNSGNYAEFDPYISYTWKWFTVGVTDYFFPNELTPNYNNRYFNYDSKRTGHAFEACITFTGPEKFPIQVFAGSLFYGADKGKDSTGVYCLGTKNNYSTYFEVSCPFTVRGISVKHFVGGIPFGSVWFGPYGGVVNAGLTVSKSIRISKEYDLSVFTSVISNPQAQSAFLVFGVSL